MLGVKFRPKLVLSKKSKTAGTWGSCSCQGELAFQVFAGIEVISRIEGFFNKVVKVS